MMFVFKTNSAAAVEQLKSPTNTPLEVVSRAHVAVEAKTPVVATGRFGRRIPEVAGGAKVLLIVNCARTTVEAPPVAGLVPA
jgi:hypothetical protein